MPTLSMFYGIVVRMNKEDGAQHNLPHVHAFHAGDEASFDIVTGKVLAGDLPQDDVVKVQAWISIHREDLLANWNLLTTEGQFFKIDPLR